MKYLDIHPEVLLDILHAPVLRLSGLLAQVLRHRTFDHQMKVVRWQYVRHEVALKSLIA